MKPAGHIAVALLTRRAIIRCTSVNLDVLGILIGSILPDLDFLLLPFGEREYIHRTFCHSPFFMLGAALLLRSRLPAGAVLYSGLLHLLVDNFWGGDPPGVAWFFPFDRKRRLIGGELGMGSNDPGTQLWAMFLEMVIVVISIALLLICHRRNNASPT